MRCVANSQRHQSEDSRRTEREREGRRERQREQVGAGGMKEKPKEKRELKPGHEILIWT